MKNWIIKKLGGYTKTDLDLNNQKWENIILDDNLLTQKKLELTTQQYYDRIFLERAMSGAKKIGKFERKNPNHNPLKGWY